MSDSMLHFNGVNGSTGKYGLPAMTGEALMRLICRQPTPDNLVDLQRRKQQDEQSSDRVQALVAQLAAEQAQLKTLVVGSTEYRAVLKKCEQLQREIDLRKDKGAKEGVDATQLSQAGWGVVFAHDADPAIKEALSPLLALRRRQAGPLFKVYEGGAGYRPGESKSRFLARHGADAAGPADPQRVPYYLLLVGGPDRIPFSFQYQLDVQYAVGRLHFTSLAEYAAYAETVVASETHGIPLPRKLSFFGVANADDPSTQLSMRHLVQPLQAALKNNPAGFSVDGIHGAEATRSRLTQLLGGADTPAILFTASHGVEFAAGDAKQLRHQGALLCADWPGPKQHGAFREDYYLAGEHIGDDARLRGVMVFGFACYGAGTPKFDEFAHQSGDPRARKIVAAQDFVGALPMRLLGHPKGGSLAFIGHVDRAWGYSYTWPGARTKSQTAAFESVMLRLLQGMPVAYALEYFNERYAELSTVLTQQLQEIDNGMDCDPYELAAMWTANNDARGYVVLGDPAARLRFADGGGSADGWDAARRAGPGPATAVQMAQAVDAGAVRQDSALARPAAPEDAVPDALLQLGCGVTAEDWRQTPPAVQRAVRRLLREK